MTREETRRFEMMEIDLEKLEKKVSKLLIYFENDEKTGAVGIYQKIENFDLMFRSYVEEQKLKEATEKGRKTAFGIVISTLTGGVAFLIQYFLNK